MSRRLLGAALGATLVLGACDEERADINSPDFPTAHGFGLVASGNALPRGQVRWQATAPHDSIQVTLNGLDSLASGSYAIWVGDTLGTSFKRLSGTLRAVRADTTFDADGNPIRTDVPFEHGVVTAFRNGGPNQTLTFRTNRASAGLGATDPVNHLIVTVETDANATTPSDAKFLFARRGTAALSTVNLIFGNYAPAVADQYQYVNSIRGRGGFRGPVLMVTDSLMSRPPRGFYFAAYAFKAALGGITPDTVYLGEQRSPYPNRSLSQRDADIRITDPENVFDQPYQIRAGQFRLSADSIAKLPATTPWKEYFEVWVTLQNKAAQDGRMGPNRVAFGVIPAVIWNGTRE
jgi:hypothetical protein